MYLKKQKHTKPNGNNKTIQNSVKYEKQNQMGLKAPMLCKHEAKSEGETMIHRKDYRSYCIPKILTKQCKIVIQYYCGKLVITKKMFGRLFIHKLKDVAVK